VSHRRFRGSSGGAEIREYRGEHDRPGLSRHRRWRFRLPERGLYSNPMAFGELTAGVRADTALNGPVD
jgi:hypothetical protein